ncbi:MAG: efflux transporter periplasmic adaptor subunit [Desulfuromonas sp.]|nr:MAG: efflux transporter periplasmic adaptor subunit [Desulfuromonas sp.]
MQLNRKIKIFAFLIAGAAIVAGAVFISLQGDNPQKAITQKLSVEESHAEHGDDSHGKSEEDLDDLFGDKDDDGHNHESHADGHDDESHNDEHGDSHAEHDEESHDDHAEKGHEGHDDHAGEEDDHTEEPVQLSSADQKEFGIVLAKAAPASLEEYVDLPGEIVLNADRVAHVVPRVSGIIRQVFKKQGDRVRKGQVMAVIESRDLADAKAEFLAARERAQLAQLSFDREERLWQKKITSEQEYLDARQSSVEAGIALRSAEQKLHALGFSDDYLATLPEQPDITYTRYEMKAPFAGIVIQKHISLGEVLEENAEAFILADLDTVWVDMQVYQKDLAAIRKGQAVVVQVGHGVPVARGVIGFVGPMLGEETRTALARVELDNTSGDYRPGMFVTARVAVAKTPVKVAVEKTALQTMEGKTVVFVKTTDGFEPRPIEIGRQNTVNLEVVSGLKAGETYAAKGAFTLKAQLSKGAFGDGHNH